VEAALAAWQKAVLEKDAGTVVKLDAAFREAPGRFGDALARSAKDAPDERVRAFSTRVLGKLKQVERAELFEQLLDDASPYVRQNAAWALGELGTETEGRMATKQALADLRHLRAGDPAGDVRSAASGAIEKLQ
jgi:HEAT repeat protein